MTPRELERVGRRLFGRRTCPACGQPIRLPWQIALARALGLAPSTVYRWIATGRISKRTELSVAALTKQAKGR